MHTHACTHLMGQGVYPQGRLVAELGLEPRAEEDKEHTE